MLRHHTRGTQGHNTIISFFSNCLKLFSDGCKLSGISVGKWIIEDISAYKLGVDYCETLKRLFTNFSNKDKTDLIIFIDDLANNSHDLSHFIFYFSFNGASHKEAFVGDFHYQYPKKEQVESDILKRRMKWMIEQFVAYRIKYPLTILIIRDGVSEGQYQMILNEELNAMRTACQEVANQQNLKNWPPKFAVVIATKRNSARFFNRLDSNISNVKPLTVIDRDITRVNINEAYIVSANAFQGTAQAVCYQLLRNEIGFKAMDEVEALLLALSSHHQICKIPISLPEPVYQADKWSKRGNEMWKEYG
ncbi:unnamed protein product [Caenorhabditis bovis]|uniref:Piwi domain-containing protein n=1 Tax=Caenorhabditis bovis TaxID=2654633 RepID=A0A8S1F846_9PELO|nr:unnamed protein product [Caenorhabditis bovis]